MNETNTYYPTLEIDYFHNKPEGEAGWQEFKYKQTCYINGEFDQSTERSVYVKRVHVFERLLEIWNRQGSTPLSFGGWCGGKAGMTKHYTLTYTYEKV